MWIILLDHSGSMGEPFSGERQFAGRSVESDTGSKLEAAVESILERLQGRDPSEHVAVIGFTSEAARLVEGPAGEFARFRKVLDSTIAADGTDIGAALLEAADLVDEHRQERFPTVLLVSDGKSGPEAAMRARERLIDRVVQISAILIDPTPEADQLFRQLIYNGELQAVTGYEELEREAPKVAARQEAFAREVEEVYRALEDETKAELQGREAVDDLCFSAAHPAEMAAARWTPLLVYLYSSRIEEQVVRALRERAEEIFLAPKIASGASNTPIPRGTELTIRPQLPGLRTNPPELTLFWEEDLHDFIFKIRADEAVAGKRILGSIDVLVDGVLIGDLPVSIQVANGSKQASGEARKVSRGRLYRRVFASYSRTDEAIIRACVSTYEALGISVYLDKMELRNKAGEAWKEALRRFIADSDVFQLYWSERARDSEWVEMEWRHALRCTGSKGQRFVRPIVWEDNFPELPQPLAALQLGFLKLDLWRTGLADKAPADSPVAAGTEPEGVVLPCRPGTDSATVRLARADVGFATRFVENTTGLRYYPVATLLVEDYVVHSVRRESTIDDPPDTGDVATVCALADLLQAIALGFHVRFRSSLSGEEDLEFSFGRNRLLQPAVYDRVRQHCEWVIRHIVHQLPGVAASVLHRAVGSEAAQQSPFPALVRGLVESVAREVGSGRRGSSRSIFDSLTAAEYDLVRSDLAAVQIRIQPQADGSIGLRADSIIPYALLTQNVADEIEYAIKSFSESLSASASPSRRDRILAGLVRTIVSEAPETLREPLQATLDGAMNPLWRRVADELTESGVSDLGTDANAAEVITWLLDTVSELLAEGARELGDPTVEIEYGIPTDAWQLCREALEIPAHVQAVERETSFGSEREPEIFLTASLTDISTLFREAAHSLIAFLPAVGNQGGTRELVVAASTFGIFTPAESPSADETLRRWACEVGIAPDLTLPGTSRVLLSLNALDRLRNLLRQSGLPPSQAALHQRSILVHEHFHAAVALGFDSDGRLPQGPRHPDLWRVASPVNEALAAWMELHLSRDQPELRAHAEAYQSRGSYPAWPYAGARSLEAVYKTGGLGAIRTWIRRLRDDPAACRAAFDSLVAASGLNPRL